MKKILVLLLFITSLGFSQTKILKKNVPTITSDMTSGISGGASNANTIAVTNLSELQSATLNKTWSIQSTIDLGNTTLNIPVGVILKFEGGKIINGTLNGNKTFIQDNGLQQIFDLTTNFTGTFKYRACYPEWFGAGSSILDNRLYFNKATTFVHSCGGGVIELWSDYYEFYGHKEGGAWGIEYDNDGEEGIIEVYDNTHIISYVNSRLEVTGDEPSVYEIYPIRTFIGSPTFYIELNNDDRVANPRQKVPAINDPVYINDIYLGTIVTTNDTEWTLDDFAFIPNTGDLLTIKVYEGNYRLFKMSDSKNSSVKGLHLKGNREFLIAQGKDPNLGSPSAFQYYGNCYNVTVEDNEIEQFPADAFRFRYEGNYEGNTPELYESGTINSITGVNEADSRFVRSENTYSLNRAKIIENDRFMMFDQGSYQQINQVPNGKLNIFYYKNDGTYLGCMLNQAMYEYLPILKETGTGISADYIKVVIEATNTSRFDYTATGGETQVPVGTIRSEVAIKNTYKDYVWKNGVLQTLNTHYTWTEEAGVQSLINFVTPLTSGDEITASFTIYRIEPKAIEVPTNINIVNNTMHDLGRQGISGTGVQDIVIHNNTCYNVYGSPGAFIDFEDGEWLNRRITISDNVVWNCNLGIHLYSVSMVDIFGNKFKRANDLVNGNRTPLVAQFSIAHVGGDINVHDNYFEYGVINISKGVTFNKNIVEFSKVEMYGGKAFNNSFNSTSLKLVNHTDKEVINQMHIYNNVFLNRPNFIGLWGAGQTMDELDPLQTPSYYFNNITRGYNPANPANFKKGLIVDNVIFEGTNGSIIINSATVNGLKTDDSPIRMLYVPQDNEKVVYKNWELKGNGSQIYFAATNTLLHHYTWDNLTAEIESTSPLLFDINTNLGSLTIKNSNITSPNSVGTGWYLIDMLNTVNKVRILNNEFSTLTSGNLINIGTSTEDATWLIKDNIFEGVLLNTTLATEMNNYEN